MECSKDMTTYKIEHQHLGKSAMMFIQFTQLGIAGHSNLSMGTQLNGDWLDHPFNSNPLALAHTVAFVLMAVRTYLERYPRRKVVIIGAEASRNRLYRMIVNRIHSTIVANFRLAGLVESESGVVKKVEFQAHLDYCGFVIEPLEDAEPP